MATLSVTKKGRLMEEKNPVGRPSGFNEAIKEKIIELAKQGKTNPQIAEIIGVHVRTIENWQGKYPDLLWAVREAKQLADELVEASLFAKCAGYSHKEVKVFQYEGEIITHEIEKHYPPDTQAMMFWLRNRQPDRWREKQDAPQTPEAQKLIVVFEDENEKE